MTKRRCPRCQGLYDLPTRFCPRDGSPLVDHESSRQGTTRVSGTARLPEKPAATLDGQVVGGRYKVIRRLGEGGMSYVYLVRDQDQDVDRALKVLTPRLAADKGAASRLEREAALARRFNHPNVCSILDVGSTPSGDLYFVMPWLRGETLNESETRRGPYPVGEAISLLRQLCAGLQHAHDLGVVHRDLKPENVMLVPDGSAPGRIRAIVMDFGLAKALEADPELVRITQTGMVLGTPEFMSPEQVHGRTLDGRSDVFGLGVLAFELLTGQLPYEGRNQNEMMLARLRGKARSLRSVRPELPPRLDAIIARCLLMEPDGRHRSMTHLGRALEELDEPGFLARLMGR